VVEIYLKQFNVYAFPNQSLFKFKVNSRAPDPVSQISSPIFISKYAKVSELTKKLARLLSGYLYFVLKNKMILVSKMRIWKSNLAVDDSLHKTLLDIEKKFATYTHVKVNASILNFSKEHEEQQIVELNIGD